jgi:prepilin-type N-terminal cleavage/methylation domain-containing protein
LKCPLARADAPDVSRCALIPPIRTPRPAFSLVELMICIAIMGVLAALAIPRYANATSNYRADAAARRIAADLALARSQARLISKPLTVAFNKSSNSYQINGMTDLFHRSTTYSVQISADPYYASFVNIVFNGAAQVTFDQYGVPSTGGTVTISVGTVSKSITLDGTSGRASIQ